jgi:8-oxo-dGTP diphosphatase
MNNELTKGREPRQRNYTCGFLFNSDGSCILLIAKKRPQWQVGFYNGIGGKIEEGETSLECMRREFREETGLDIQEWQRFAFLHDMRNYQVDFYFTYYSGLLTDAQNMTDEELGIFEVDNLPNVIPNLTWLIPMALNIHRDNADTFEVVEYVAGTEVVKGE